MTGENEERAETADRAWFEDAFGELYSLIYAHRTVEAAAPEAAFAAHVLNLTSADSVLDLCCGGGRHLFHLGRIAGMTVGLDYSRALLSQGRALLGQSARLVRADMRAIPFANGFDCVTNFFTSFGYFADDADNAAVAAGIRVALRPGGRFFVDHANAKRVRATLEVESVRTHGEYEIREFRWIDEARRRVEKRMKVMRGDSLVRTFHESVRLYEPAELQGLFSRHGLYVTEIYGDWTGEDFGEHSPRMLLRGVAQ